MITEEEALADRDKLIKIDEEKYIEDIEWLLNSPEGFRFFKRFFSTCNIFGNTFTGNSRSYYLDGQRELALSYFKDFTRANPGKMSELWLEIVKEEN